MHGGYFEVFGDRVIMKLTNGCIELLINVQGINIMIVDYSWLTAKEKDLYEARIISSLLYTSLYSLNFLGDLHTHNKTHYLPIKK